MREPLGPRPNHAATLSRAQISPKPSITPFKKGKPMLIRMRAVYLVNVDQPEASSPLSSNGHNEPSRECDIALTCFCSMATSLDNCFRLGPRLRRAEVPGMPLSRGRSDEVLDDALDKYEG